MFAVCGDELESLTEMVTEKLPACVGVPEISPVPPASINPAGSEPDVIDHVYGVVPPLAPSVPEYAVPTCPLGKVAVVIVTGEGDDAATVTVYALLAVCGGELESAT